MRETRCVVCAICGGDGFFDESGHRWRKCEPCDGKGEIEVEIAPIEMEDLQIA